MINRSILTACILAAAMGVLVAQEETKYELAEKHARGDVCTVDSQVDMAMDIELKTGGNTRKLPVKFKGVNEYVQKVLELGGDGRPGKVARRYEKSTMATEKPDGKQQSGPTSFDGNTYVIDMTGDELKISHAGGKELSKGEKKELGAAVEGSMHRVLPEKQVAIGDSWDVPLEAIREIHSIDTEIKGTAKATFAGIEKFGEYESAVIKIQIDVDTAQGAMTLKYKGLGKAYFALEEKKIICIDSTALISVSGSQKTAAGEIEFGGGGSARSTYRIHPGKGEIELPPPGEKKEEEKESENGQDK